MTDIEKALAMIAPSAFYEINPENVSILVNAFKAAIEQHEAFRQEVSDAVESYFHPFDIPLVFQDFISPKPKPDPLEDVLEDICIAPHHAKIIRAALDALGFEIREKGQ